MAEPTPRTIRRDARRILKSTDSNDQSRDKVARRASERTNSAGAARNLLTTISRDGPATVGLVEAGRQATHRNVTPSNNANNSTRVPAPLMGKSQALWSAILAGIPMIYLFVVGGFLFVAPSKNLDLFFSCFDKGSNSNHNKTSIEEFLVESPGPAMLEVGMARIVGSVLLGQVLSCISLMIPLQNAAFWNPSSDFLANSPNNAALLDKFRSAVASLSIVGLLVFVAGLVDDRTSFHGSDTNFGDMSILWDEENKPIYDSSESCSSLQSTFIVASGALVLVFSSASMMVSFWSISSSMPSNSASQSTRNTQQRAMRIETTDEGDAQTPLLLGSNQEEGAQELEAQAIEPATTGATATRMESSDNEPTSRIRGTTRLLKLAAPQVFYLYIGCAVLLIRLPFSLSIPHFVSTILGAVSRGDFSAARREILLLFILGTIDAAFDFWCVFLFGYANQRIVRGLRIDTFLSILRQEVAFFDKTTSGELASRLNSDCGEMAGDLTWFFRFSIESVVRITGIVSYMLIRCPILAGCAITVIPIVAVVNKIYGNWLNKNAQEVQNALAAANHVAHETFSCIRTVVAFASERQEYKKYKECIDHQYRLNVRQIYISGVYYMVISTFLINTVVQATLLIIGTALIQHGKLTGEILLAFMLYQGQLQSETMNLFQSYTSLIKSSGAGDKVFSLLDRHPQAPGTGSAAVTASELEDVAQDGRQRLDLIENSSSCSVEFKDVYFSYPCRPDNQVLRNFSLDIPQGKTVALVGSSGCGKSTVIGLLQRFYDPFLGSVCIDGEDLRSLDVKAHRRRIGVVTQNPVLFKGTILSNITYGAPDASRTDAVEAARLANAFDFINSFPDGFETDVGERGVQLSGGQMQRITIARAIIKKPSLLLLDEATSALDAASEQAVQDALDKLLKTNSNMTTVVIAHRLRTVRNADLIAFVEGGRVAEIGTHEELLKQPAGHYRKMVEKAGNDGHLPEH